MNPSLSCYLFLTNFPMYVVLLNKLGGSKMKKKYTIEMNDSPILKEFDKLVDQKNMVKSFAMEESMKLWIEENNKNKQNPEKKK